MCDSQRPLEGADSYDITALSADGAQGNAADYMPRPYRCLVTDELGDRFYITVNAIGPNDAKGLAKQTAYDRDQSDVTVMEVVAA